MIVAADDVGDAHVVIVDDDGEHVGRRAVRAEQDEIVELVVLHGDPALDLVLDHRLALARRLQADDEGRVGDWRSGNAVAPGAFDPERAALGAGRLALRGQLLLASASSDRRGRRRATRARPRRGGRRIRDWKYAWPSQSRPSQRIPSRIASIAGWVERARSVSSMRSRNLPPWWRANSQLNKAVRAPPIWRKPVGEGAKRVTIWACAQARESPQHGPWRPETRARLAWRTRRWR